MHSILCEDGKRYDVLVLFTFGDKVRKARPLCKLLNAVLPVSSILTFIIGVVLLFWQNSGRIPIITRSSWCPCSYMRQPI